MAEAGFTEYVHAPSLVQHTGEVSSMGNPWDDTPGAKRYPFAQTFPGKDFDPLTLLDYSHESTLHTVSD
jgi:hypothetical protein